MSKGSELSSSKGWGEVASATRVVLILLGQMCSPLYTLLSQSHLP